MKTLLFNGCSFMAGDELAWEKYCLEKRGYARKWEDYWMNERTSDEDRKFICEYRDHYRKLHNLPALTSSHLNCEKVDLSEDGNSNDNIALATISYLLSVPVEERSKFHVCIGWTATPRFIKYLSHSDYRYYANIHINHIGLTNGQPEFKKIQSYIDAVFRELSDEDLWLNFVRNILMLENFLMNNGITYTFYKALGETCDTQLIGPYPPLTLPTPADKITDESAWYDFKVLNPYNHLYQGGSWATVLTPIDDYWISKENRHPNLKAVEDFSVKLADFIKNQNVIS